MTLLPLTAVPQTAAGLLEAVGNVSWPNTHIDVLLSDAQSDHQVALQTVPLQQPPKTGPKPPQFELPQLDESEMLFAVILL